MEQNEAREIFTKNLNKLMEIRGITQADICEELGVSSSTVSDWCNGLKYPRVNKIQRLADLFNVRMSVLTDENDMSEVADQDRLEALHQNPRLGLLFDRQRKMKAEDIDFMIQMAERIIRERDGDD